jgi:hypothetical protein
VKFCDYSYEPIATIAAADMVSVRRRHFGYTLYEITVCSLGMLKHYVKEEHDLFVKQRIIG